MSDLLIDLLVLRAKASASANDAFDRGQLAGIESAILLAKGRMASGDIHEAEQKAIIRLRNEEVARG